MHSAVDDDRLHSFDGGGITVTTGGSKRQTGGGVGGGGGGTTTLYFYIGVECLGEIKLVDGDHILLLPTFLSYHMKFAKCRSHTLTFWWISITRQQGGN